MAIQYAWYFLNTKDEYIVEMDELHLPVTYLGNDSENRAKIHKLKRELEEVIKIVKGDLERIVQRGSRLDTLSARVCQLFIKKYSKVFPREHGVCFC